MRVWVVLLFALLLGVTRDAQAQALRRAPDEEVTVFAPPPIPTSGSSAATLKPAAPDIDPFIGQTLSQVDILLDDNRWPDVALPSLTVMHAGDKVSYEIVRKAMAEVLATAHFSDAYVSIANDGTGAHATVHVMPRKVIDRVRVDLHGEEGLDGDQLVRDAELETEGELVAGDFDKYKARVEALLQRRGYPAPRIKLTTKGTQDPIRVELLVDVQVGAPRRIERRVIYPMGGSTAEADIAEKTYLVKVGERIDEYQLTNADTELQSRVRARGFVKAVVYHDVVLHKGFIVLRVRIDFGMRIDTRYDGAEHFDKATLDGVLDLDNETDRTAAHLVEKVHEYYVKHGFLDAEVTVEDRGGASDPVHYYVFHVQEHGRVKVAGRAYPCLSEADVKKLDGGGPTSAKKIGDEIDSFLQEELPGGELIVNPNLEGVDRTVESPLTKGRPSPLELDPNSVYVPETYERAVSHVQELYRAEGYLAAQVGPVQVLRRKCNKRSPPGECLPDPIPTPPDVCTYDAAGVPLPVSALEQGSTCVPDPTRGITCEPRVWLRIPVKLGPRTQLWDVAFSGATSIPPETLLKAADTQPGAWVSNVKLEEARRRVVDAYKEEGYAFVDVKYQLEQSTDRTRARVRFVVTESEKVTVREIQIRGNSRTNTATILKRVALTVGQPYRASEIRKTEERIATLGVFSTVQVSLENPFVPQRNKTVIITVDELKNQYVTPLVGFSSGEGFRLSTEYGHRNLWGRAVQLTLRLQLAYIPTVFIIDETARNNYRDLNTLARLAVRATASLSFPEIGLGPLVRAGVDGILVHDLQRDFYITKVAVIPNMNWRPVSELQISYFQGFELNNSRIFQSSSISDYLSFLSASSGGTVSNDLIRQLLVPDGESYVVSERVLVSWDRRDNAFNAKKGTYTATGIEHIDAFPILEKTETAQFTAPKESHLVKLTQTFSGYIELPLGMRIASQTRLGGNVQLTQNSSTYPDRLFFLGGVESMRGWTLNSFIPQDVVDLIEGTKNLPDRVSKAGDSGGVSAVPNGAKVTPATRPVNGGNLMFTEKLELRIPIRDPIETVIFMDVGNLWTDIRYPFDAAEFPLRADVGTGLRVTTPIGPLAVDYGINITRKRAYEDFGALNFAIGLF